MSREEKENKLKLGRCHRCGHEESVKYKDRYKKYCLECHDNEAIIEMMRLVPAHFIDPEAVATIESDYKDWVDKDGRRQETLS